VRLIALAPSVQPEPLPVASEMTTIAVMKIVTLARAKAGLSALIDRVEDGEVVAISRRHRVVAELRPVTPQRTRPRPAGLAHGEFRVPDDFHAPLPDDVLGAFEGR
jgi:antitoxin (DNA-binding transcriptional repressor) of toxin-antitoxin stability system